MLKNFTVFLISNDNFFFWEGVLGVGDINNGLSTPRTLTIFQYNKKKSKKSGQFPTVLLSYIYKVQNT